MCRAIKGGELAKSFEQWLVYTVNTFKNRSTFQTISIAFVNLLLLLIKWQKKQKSAILILILSNKKSIKPSLAET